MVQGLRAGSELPSYSLPVACLQHCQDVCIELYLHVCIEQCVCVCPANTAKVVVQVQDENDHAPEFLQPLYLGGVAEDAKTFTSVLQVQVRHTWVSLPTCVCL